MFFKAVLTVLLIGILLPGVLGCAEGPLWRTGYLSPWVRQKWQEEEQIAASLNSRRADLGKQVNRALASDVEAQQKMAIKLGEIVAKDPVKLMRIEAARLLGDLPVQAAGEGLQVATHDREVAVRSAAVRSLGRRSDAISAALLANISRKDENLDVRIAATRELGNFHGDVPMSALGEALSHPNPAMQLSAAEALKQSTGKDMGRDIQEWQRFVDTRIADRETDGLEARTGQSTEFR